MACFTRELCHCNLLKTVETDTYLRDHLNQDIQLLHILTLSVGLVLSLVRTFFVFTIITDVNKPLKPPGNFQNRLHVFVCLSKPLWKYPQWMLYLPFFGVFLGSDCIKKWPNKSISPEYDFFLLLIPFVMPDIQNMSNL